MANSSITRAANFLGISTKKARAYFEETQTYFGQAPPFKLILKALLRNKQSAPPSQLAYFIALKYDYRIKDQVYDRVNKLIYPKLTVPKYTQIRKNYSDIRSPQKLAEIIAKQENDLSLVKGYKRDYFNVQKFWRNIRKPRGL